MMKILYVLPVLAVLGMLSAAHAQVQDTTSPTFESGTYNKETGVMTLTFSEAIDISETKLNRIFLNDDKLNSAGAIDRNTPDSATLTITVNPPLLDALAAADSVEIDFKRNAVADIAGNVIQASRNHALVLAEEPPDTPMPPVAPDTTATTPEDTPVDITPAISDPNMGDTPMISGVTDPPKGSASFDDTTITYTPDLDYEGTDTFDYTVTDGQAETQGTITVTVTRDNNDPILETIGDQSASVGTQLDIAPVVTDDDSTDTHTFSINRGTLPTAAVFTASDGSLVWTPGSGDAGSTHTVTITVDDGRGGTDSETFDIAVGTTDIDTPPQLVSATLDMSDGTMTLVFDEVIDTSSVYPGDMSLLKTDGTQIVLNDGTVETVDDSDTVIIVVDQATLEQIGDEATLRIQLSEDSVADTSQNGISNVISRLEVIPAVGETPVDETPQTVATVTITAAGRFVEDAGTVEITRSDSMTFTVEFTNNHNRDHTILADTISYNDWHSGADIPIAQGETVTATFTIKDTQTIRDRPTVYFVFGAANDLSTTEHEPDTIKGDHLVKIRITEPAS